MLKQTIKKWNQSIELYEAGNIGEALKVANSIETTTSKINYNIGVMNIKNNSFKNAVEYFNRSVEQDKYLAASYYMRAIAHHLNGELNHAIVDYDETISKLRGHEFIDYVQLGLDHKLLLAEVLFNKALALGKAGSSVANQATLCLNQPQDVAIFKENCRKITSGAQFNFGTRPIPFNILFKPPKVSDGPPKSRSAATSSTNTLTTPSGPPTYVLKGPTVSTPSTSVTANTPPKPPSQTSKPSFGSPSSSSPTLSSSPSSPSPPSIPTSRILPPKPPPLPSKKLPSRPISCVIEEVKITLKIFYNDRRLIQIPSPCNISTFKQKIEAKFEISIDDSISISFELDGEENIINSQVQLDKMICMDIKEIRLTDVDSSNDSSFSSSSKPTSLSSSYDSGSKSSYRPKATTVSSSSSSKQYFTLPRNSNVTIPLPPKAPTTPSPSLSNLTSSISSSYSSTTSSFSPPTLKPRSNTPVGPPIPGRTFTNNFNKPTSTTTSINIPPKIPTSSRPGLTQSDHSPPTPSPNFKSLSSSYGGSTYPYK